MLRNAADAGGALSTLPRLAALRACGVSDRVWLVILGIAGLALYASGLNIGYYGDDFDYLSTYIDWPPNGMYRPAHIFVLHTIQRLVGFSPVPIHLVQLALHVALACLVYRAARAIGVDGLQAALGSIFMLVSQANAFGVLSNCTLSQVGGASFGYFSLWYARRAFLEDNRACRLASLTSFAVALLFKESSVAFLPMLPVALLASDWTSATSRKDLARKTAAQFIPAVAVLIGYLVLRQAGGADPIRLGTASRYEFSFGFNVLKNGASFLLSAFTPVSSVTVYELATGKHILPLLLVLLATAVFVTMVGIGIYRCRRWLWVILFVLAGLSLGPMLVLAKVSELYTYNAMPVVALIVGGGLGSLISNSGRLMKAATVTGTVAVLLSHVVAVQQKSHLMSDNGRRAAVLFDDVVEIVRTAPSGVTVRMENSTSDRGYSIFVMPEFSVLIHAQHAIQVRAGRPDVAVVVTPPWTRLTPNNNEIRLRIQNARAVVQP